MTGCTEIFNNYLNLVKKLTPTENKGPQGVKMGSKSLGKKKKFKTYCHPKQLLFHAPFKSNWGKWGRVRYGRADARIVRS